MKSSIQKDELDLIALCIEKKLMLFKEMPSSSLQVLYSILTLSRIILILIIMKKLTLQVLLMLFLSVNLFAQDTIVVQTLTFDSITTRRGIWEFPTGEEFRKILMVHTLKCDAQTTHDQYPCGEWDYLTYNKVYMHTGAYDSTLYYHPSYTFANDRTADSVLVSYDTVYNYFSHQHTNVSFQDTLSYEMVEVGDNGEYATLFPAPFNSGSSQFLWKADELTDAGFSEGNISGIKLYSLEFPYYTSNVMVRMASTELNEITPDTLINQLDTVFYHDMDFAVYNWNDINFTEPFYWDGTSNIIIDFSYTDPDVLQYTLFFGEDPGFNCGISSGSDNYALDLDGKTDFLKLPEDTYFNSDFTFEAWICKRNNNTWSRVFDFGNGPNQNNVIVAFRIAVVESFLSISTMMLRTAPLLSMMLFPPMNGCISR